MVTTSQVIRFITVRITEGIIVLLLIMFMPNIPPHCKIQDPTPVTPAMPFEGNLRLNERLNEASIWLKGELHGPEALADYNGELYASLQTGEVVRISGDRIVPIVKFGKSCRGFHQEKICGRPLGIQFDKDGSLIAADAYYGIYRVDVSTGDAIQLISPDEEIEGKKPKIPNSVAIASNGDIYWSDSSTEFLLEDGLIDMFSDGSGRLIHYDVKTKKNTVLMDNLLFANGVALSDDEEYVIVAETGRSCIHRFFLKGPNKGKRDMFIDGLPGLPDNIKPDGQGGFIVPLITARDDYTPLPMQVLGNFPLFRKLVARFFGLGELGLHIVQKVYENEIAERMLHLIGHFYVVSFVQPSRVSILHLSRTGQVIDSLHANNRKMLSICEAHIFDDYLYLGSPFNDYIGRIPLRKIGWEHLQKQPQPTPTEAPTTKAPSTTAAPKATTPKIITAKPVPTTPPAKAKPTPTPKPTAKPSKEEQPKPTPIPEKAPPPTQKPATKTESAKPAQPKTAQPDKETKPTSSQSKPTPQRQESPSRKEVPK